MSIKDRICKHKEIIITKIQIKSYIIKINVDDNEPVSRESVFTEGPFALHVCSDTEITVKAEEDSEILVQCTKNDAKFDSKLYRPEDAPWGYSCVGKFGNVAKRRVNTIIDKEIAPYSNMVLGEVFNQPGRWSSYPPHHHPQPEVYYYRFDKPQGFGACFNADEVYKSVDSSACFIHDGEDHQQVVAPGYNMYYVWMIRHLDGDPWLQTTRNEDEKYVWLHDAEF